MSNYHQHPQINIIVPSLAFHWTAVRELDKQLQTLLKMRKEDYLSLTCMKLEVSYHIFINNMKYEVMSHLDNRLQTRNVLKAKIECEQIILISFALVLNSGNHL